MAKDTVQAAPDVDKVVLEFSHEPEHLPALQIFA